MRLALATLAAALAATACVTPQRTASIETVAAYVAQARQLAGTDLTGLLPLCEPAPSARATQAQIDQLVARQIARPAPAPGQAFDNLFYVGGAWASAWALRTSEGIVLIDALNNGKEVADVLEPGLRKVGLDPASIRAIVVTHAHGDHYGGAVPLVKKTGARVAMSDVDWAVARVKPEVDSSEWGPMPVVDTVLRQGESLTVGDARITAQLTPGHTVGTLSPVFEVRDRGRSHKVLLWGGTAFNFGRDFARMDSYIAATERMAQLARSEGIDVLLSNHPSYDDTVAKLARRQSAPDGPNPFVMGTDNVVRALQVMGACARAQRDRFAMEPGQVARRWLPMRDDDDGHGHGHADGAATHPARS